MTFVLKRETLGCLDSRLMLLNKNPHYVDLYLFSKESVADKFPASKILMAAISQKIRMEIEKSEQQVNCIQFQRSTSSKALQNSALRHSALLYPE
jgi:hypothetical protein